MAKKRDRRVSFDPDRPPSRSELSNRQDSPNPRLNTNKGRSFLITALIFILAPAISVYLYRIVNAPRTDVDSSLPYVYRRGLVKTDVSYLEILTENTIASENTSIRHFTNPVLAYITPWNSRGYDLAKLFNSKLTHISPVWYDLKRYC